MLGVRIRDSYVMPCWSCVCIAIQNEVMSQDQNFSHDQDWNSAEAMSLQDGLGLEHTLSVHPFSHRSLHAYTYTVHDRDRSLCHRRLSNERNDLVSV